MTITSTGIIELFLNKVAVPVKIFFILTLHVNDVAIIALTQGEIRIEIKCTFCICWLQKCGSPNLVSSVVNALYRNQ